MRMLGVMIENYLFSAFSASLRLCVRKIPPCLPFLGSMQLFGSDLWYNSDRFAGAGKNRSRLSSRF